MLLPTLVRRYRVSCVDLPGHGASRALPMPASLAALAKLVLEAAPASAVWLGWSLGGLICLRIALDFPAHMQALMLSNSTPRFVSAPDWPYAMSCAQLEAFAAELAGDFSGTVRRFLALQTLGDEHAAATLRVLRDSVSARGEPDAASLATALALLRDSDVRDELHRLRLPTRILTGDYDRLTPPQAGGAMANMISESSWISFPRTAHAPFISHPADFVRVLDEFMDTIGFDQAARYAD
jgi:pimeloyl-[acyl-carrier protein] methyl ester esterase